MTKKVIFIGIGILLIILIFSKGTLSSEETIEKFNLTLEYNTDENIFKNNIYNFIDLVDDSLIPTSSFLQSSQLNENYDFLTNFAILFILNNEDKYIDKITYLDEYVYVDDYGNVYSTNKYVSVETIYEITSNVLGKDYYYIYNEQLSESDELIPLLLIDNYSFFMEIDEIIDIVKFSSGYNVYVSYKDMDYKYVYRLEDNDGQLFISNLSIEE